MSKMRNSHNSRDYSRNSHDFSRDSSKGKREKRNPKRDWRLRRQIKEQVGSPYA